MTWFAVGAATPFVVGGVVAFVWYCAEYLRERSRTRFRCVCDLCAARKLPQYVGDE